MFAAAVKNVNQAFILGHLALALSTLGLVVILPAIFQPEKFKKAFEEFLNSGNVNLRMMAILNFFLSFLILNSSWRLSPFTPRSIMAVLGYLLFVRGVAWMWFPDASREWMKSFLRKEYGVYVVIFFGLIFTLGLGYLGIKVY